MTAFSSIYTSLTGMLSYSDALNSVSNDIANLNVPGYKANDLLFRDLPPTNYQFADGGGSYLFQEGNGAVFSGTIRNFSQGPFQATGGATDLSINGPGFFVLKNSDGDQVFSQAGQFTFDSNGFLIDSASKARVQGYATGSTALGDVQIPTAQESPPTATSTITLTGNLDTTNSTSSSSPSTATATISNVIDATGATHTITLTFTQSAVGSSSWNVTATDEKGNNLTLSPGSISFNGSGSAVSPTSLELNFQGSFLKLQLANADGTNSVTAFSGNSTIAGTADGTALGTLTGVTVDQNGILQLAYSNGVTNQGPQLAVATFSAPQELINLGGALFQANSSLVGATPNFGTPGTGGIGHIQSGQLELSNVNLSDEFSTIVVLQNGYQGSSQILNVANQLLSDLYQSLHGGGGSSA